MIKLGLHTAILDGLAFKEVVDYASDVGFQALEVCCWPVGGDMRRYGGVTHIDVTQIDEKRANNDILYAEDRGLTIASLAYFPNPLSDDPEIAAVAQAHLKKVFKAASTMKVDLVTTFIGKNKTKSVEENIEIMIKTWTPLMREAEDLGVRVAIENCPMYFTKDEWPGGNNLASTPQVWREMFGISPNMGLCFDPSHMVLLGMDECSPIINFRDRIFHIHLKDMRIDQSKVNEYGRFSYPGLWHTPKLPGLGEVDFPRLISCLHEVGFNACACLECEDRSFEGSADDVRAGIAQAYRYLRTVM